MKTKEREKAIELRRQQWTYAEIAEHLNVSKGTVSLWLRDVPYKPRQEVIERIHRARIRNSNVLHQRKAARISLALSSAKGEVQALRRAELRILGAVAYWAEGSKTIDSVVKFTNTDPELILLVLCWLREICCVPDEKLRFHLRAHPGEDVAKLEQFWSELTSIPASQFYRTTLKRSESGGRTAKKLRHGIASLIVCDTNLFYRIQGWIQAIKEQFTSGKISPQSLRSLMQRARSSVG